MTIYQYPDYMYHHGVKGMKWGVRKKYQTSGAQNRLDSAKAEYKSAKKVFNKSYGKAYKNSQIHPITQFATKKGRAKSDALWDQAYKDARRVKSTKSEYKQAKKAYKIDKRSVNKDSTSKKIKTGLKVAAGVGATVAAVYGTRKLGDWIIGQETKRAAVYGEQYVQGLLSQPTLKTATLKTPDIATMALKTPDVKKALRI